MKSLRIAARILVFCVASHGLWGAQAVQSGYVNVGPDKIYFETAGSGQAIVFIHDGVVHSRVWDDQFAWFSKNYQVIRFDRRGYGNSTAATVEFSNEEDLNALLIHLNVERASLVGMSSGGGMSIDFTLKYPQKVSSLILVGAVVGGFPYTDHFFTRGGHLPADLKTMEERRAYYAADDPYEIYSENKAAKEKVKDLVHRFPRKRAGEFHSTSETAAAGAAKPPYQRLGEIKVPALILVGEFDMPDVHAHAGAINAGIAMSKREIISRSGHLIPVEQPASFNDAVMRFYKEMSSR